MGSASVCLVSALVCWLVTAATPDPHLQGRLGASHKHISLNSEYGPPPPPPAKPVNPKTVEKPDKDEYEVEGSGESKPVPDLKGGWSERPDEDICNYPASTGMCRAYFERWFFNRTSQSCEPFVWGGCEGNPNNFETEEECNKTCDFVLAVVVEEEEFLMSMRRDEGDKAQQDKDEVGEGSGDESGESSEEDEEKKDSSEEEDDDEQEKEEAKFLRSKRRDEGDESKDEVEEGSGADKEESSEEDGDKKKDSSEEEDEDEQDEEEEAKFQRSKRRDEGEELQEGSGETVEGSGEVDGSGEGPTKPVRVRVTPPRRNLPAHCYLKPKRGKCLSILYRWSYSPRRDLCEPFLYGGCGGNRNNFLSQSDCEADCMPVNVTLQPGKVLNSDMYRFCQLDEAAGSTKAYTLRWRFDKRKTECRPFFYAGCGGNANNFASYKECASWCEGEWNGVLRPAPVPVKSFDCPLDKERQDKNRKNNRLYNRLNFRKRLANALFPGRPISYLTDAPVEVIKVHDRHNYHQRTRHHHHDGSVAQVTRFSQPKTSLPFKPAFVVGKPADNQQQPPAKVNQSLSDLSPEEQAQVIVQQLDQLQARMAEGQTELNRGFRSMSQTIQDYGAGGFHAFMRAFDSVATPQVFTESFAQLSDLINNLQSRIGLDKLGQAVPVGLDKLFPGDDQTDQMVEDTVPNPDNFPM